MAVNASTSRRCVEERRAHWLSENPVNATVSPLTYFAGVSIATQFPETVEDYLENQRLRVLTVRAKKRPEGLFTKLSCLKRTIDEFRR
eukprot:1983808-Rhodomonas_salina.1